VPGIRHGGAVMLLCRLGDFFLRLDCNILLWGGILEGKNGELRMEKREDPVHQEHPIFLFLVDVSIFYWWAKIPSFLPRPDRSYSLLEISSSKSKLINKHIKILA